VDFRSLKEFVVDSIKYIILTVGIFLIVLYICSLQQIVGPSMEPNLNNENVLLINKLVFKFRKPARFEIITFTHDDGSFLVKRIIGLPGDTLFYKDNALFINGTLFEESFLTDVITEDFSLKDLGYEIIPDDMYFVLGDNRNNSLDSRHFGLIEKKQFIGKPFLKIFPFKEIHLIK